MFNTQIEYKMRNKLYLILMVSSTLLALTFSLNDLSAQKMTCRTGHVSIESSNAVSNIEADNYQVQSTLNTETGDVSFVGLTKSFSLESGALDKAFNSQYVNVDGYSKFKYQGKLTNLDEIDFNKAGEYEFDVIGDLVVGESKRRTQVIGTLIVNSDLTIQAYSDFSIKIEQANVDQINTLLKERISESINFEVLGVSRDINLSVLFNYR